MRGMLECFKNLSVVGILLPAALLLLPGPRAAAQDVITDDGVGGMTMLFAHSTPDPAALAMGSTAAVGVQNPAYAAFSNPVSVLWSENRFQAGVGAFPGSRISAAASGRVGGRIALAAGFCSQSGESYILYDGGGCPTGQYSPRYITAGFGAAARIAGPLSIGLNVKYLRQDLAEQAIDDALAADIFAAVEFAGFRIAAGMSTLRLSGASSLPTSITAGAGYRRNFGQHAVDAALQMDWYPGASGALQAGAGAAYSFRDMLFLRAGYCHCSAQAPLTSFVSLGAGLKIRFARLDFTWIPTDGTVCAGLGVAF